MVARSILEIMMNSPTFLPCRRAPGGSRPSSMPLNIRHSFLLNLYDNIGYLACLVIDYELLQPSPRMRACVGGYLVALLSHSSTSSSPLISLAFHHSHLKFPQESSNPWSIYINSQFQYGSLKDLLSVRCFYSLIYLPRRVLIPSIHPLTSIPCFL